MVRKQLKTHGHLLLPYFSAYSTMKTCLMFHIPPIPLSHRSIGEIRNGSENPKIGSILLSVISILYSICLFLHAQKYWWIWYGRFSPHILMSLHAPSAARSMEGVWGGPYFHPSSNENPSSRLFFSLNIPHATTFKTLSIFMWNSRVVRSKGTF